MSNINQIQIPLHVVKKQNTLQEDGENVLLDVLLQLVWEDTDSFLSLQKQCTSRNPGNMEEETKEKLIKLGLIDEMGHPTIRVYRIMNSISESYYSCYSKQRIPL